MIYDRQGTIIAVADSDTELRVRVAGCDSITLRPNLCQWPRFFLLPCSRFQVLIN